MIRQQAEAYRQHLRRHILPGLLETDCPEPVVHNLATSSETAPAGEPVRSELPLLNRMEPDTYIDVGPGRESLDSPASLSQKLADLSR